MIRSDDRYFPVILNCWSGPFTKDEVVAQFDVQCRLARRAKREGVWLVSITNEGDPPSSAERKYIADCTRAMPPDLRERTIVSFAVIDSAVKRGVLTALSWLISDLTTVEPVGTLAEALAGARRALAAKGVEFPASLEVAELRRALEQLNADPRARVG